MENTTSLGKNRTGAQMSPLDAHRMHSYAQEHSPLPPKSPLLEDALAGVRSDYVHEAERIGSVPPPATLTGAASSGLAKLTGKRPEVLVDKLGERLAFERTGVRLYQALIDKVLAQDPSAAFPFQVADLERIRDQEFEHMLIVKSALESIGADPTAQTPCADVAGVMSAGILQVLADPRTNIAQSLSAILTAELTDQASWDLLARLAEASGQDDLLPQLRHGLEQEEQHVQQVRGWVASLVLDEAT